MVNETNEQHIDWSTSCGDQHGARDVPRSVFLTDSAPLTVCAMFYESLSGSTLNQLDALASNTRLSADEFPRRFYRSDNCHGANSGGVSR
jgi:hypothetical protein